MRSALAVGILASVTALGGCATIISGSQQTLTVNANVQGATVYLNQRPLGQTPLVVRIERGQEGTLSVQKQGYAPYQVSMNKKVNGVFWVNILSGGLFGSSTDYSSGAMYEYEPDTYFVSLQPAGGPPGAREKSRRREALRAFVLLNNEALVADLAAGRGEYVDGAARLLEVEPERRADAIGRWRAAYAASDTAAAFAHAIVSELR